LRSSRAEQCGDRHHCRHDRPARRSARSGKSENADDSIAVAFRDQQRDQRPDDCECDQRAEGADERHSAI